MPNTFYDQLYTKANVSIGRTKKLMLLILDYATVTYHEQQKTLQTLKDYLWDYSSQFDITDVFSGKDYKVLVKLLGSNLAEKFKVIWDQSTNYPYSTGYNRRSFRMKEQTECYLEPNLRKLLSLLEFVKEGYTLETYLQENKEHFSINRVIPDLIAFELDQNNQSIINTIDEMIYSENNHVLLSSVVIKGLLRSHQKANYKKVGDLLLAARLQEGLRQSIVESIDEATIEGFIYMLKVIVNNNLYRYSSVVRALSVWTGLGLEVERPKVIKTTFEMCLDSLENTECINLQLEGSNKMNIYIALWSIGVRNLSLTSQHITEFMNGSKQYKKKVLLYFLSQTGHVAFQYQQAIKFLKDENLEVFNWVIENIYPVETAYQLIHSFPIYKRLGIIPKEQAERHQLYNQLKERIETLPEKELKFTDSGFKWINSKLSVNKIVLRMMFLAGYQLHERLVDDLYLYMNKVSPETREIYVDYFLEKPKNDCQRQFLFNFLKDRSVTVRKKALDLVTTLSLKEDEVQSLEGLLSLKSPEIRTLLIRVLSKQSQKNLNATLSRLVVSKNENKRLAALDMILKAKKYQPDFNHQNYIEKIEQPTEKEKVLINNLIDQEVIEYSSENGFGLYDPNAKVEIPRFEDREMFNFDDIFNTDLDEIKRLFLELYDIIDQNRNYEYTTEYFDGSKHKVILGSSNRIEPINYKHHQEIVLGDLPLNDVFKSYFETNIIPVKTLLEMLFYYRHLPYNGYDPEFKKWLDKIYPAKRLEHMQNFVKDIEYKEHIRTVLEALLKEYPKEEVFSLSREASLYIQKSIKDNLIALEEVQSYYGYLNRASNLFVSDITYWIQSMKTSIYDDSSFKDYFFICYHYYKRIQFAEFELALVDFARAYELGAIPKDEIYKELMDRPHRQKSIYALFTERHIDYRAIHQYPVMHQIEEEVKKRILDIELKRGDLPTKVTPLATNLTTIRGLEYFIAILVGIGKEKFTRGYLYTSMDASKKDLFSYLLKQCFPGKEDNAEKLKDLIKNKKISHTRLLEAAMYAPQWVNVIESYIGWEGLNTAVWYFHAHINEDFSDEKETMVARYSDISPKDFNDGAFDINWFNEAYRELGESRFNSVYKCAKYISGGANHRRSQLFADAVLGKLDLKTIETSIKQKRNKDHVLCYGLIPLQGDTLKRYEFLQEFLKESKQFGAQRRESEAKVVNIALQNLARNAGYNDVNRLIWNMETEKFDDLKKYFNPMTIDDYTLQLDVDGTGMATIHIEKSGKTLKSVPRKLNKNDEVKALKTIQKSLKDQFNRAKHTLETSMENQIKFSGQELLNLSRNPVLFPLIKNLVFKVNGYLGFYQKDTSLDCLGTKVKTSKDNEFVIAHPVDLFESGEWEKFQSYLYEAKIVQPFKQIFRELYTLTEDELEEQTVSRRYAGHQVQPNKALALLKNRLWTANHQEGLQKVFYNENIRVNLYAYADWFSPADIEAPTIEEIEFVDRKTTQPIKLTEISKVIFSEVMRDLDLVVSVAHVGGVDPEATLSTIEMRKAIIRESLRLFKVNNVEITGSHAHVKGELGEYTVHLGSAIVHRQAKAAIHILPVHSSHRGQLFLPYMDDDPKTSEILSKVLLLANDHKIKDPSILNQIKP
ncbi:DUF4132 domain-containing protein [Haloplasma contractile]|uniref:DUF4132 domain-containing protein n=1 Tax=Haloplasma contractile SSD-17B TaxID=1033810 RepID=F7PWD5_9MOLU|nr:DUF4132 domain-containing protein [Haloplasma contractile]ERJ13286.1 hypothetical protein HLPCO_000915 [Haloplasma contractile SSD-17B]